MSADPPVNEASTSKKLGKAASQGVSLLMFATLLGKCASFIAQIVLGYLLSKEDFAVYGIAIGVAAFGRAFQSGAVQRYLMGRSSDVFDAEMAPCFWMATAFNIGIALILSIAAYPVGVGYGDERIGYILWIVAGSLLLQSPATTLTSRMHIDFKHASLARMNVYISLIRHGLVIAFAAFGCGALSFVLPLLVIPVFQTWYSWLVVRRLPWSGGMQTSLWPDIFKHTKWLMIAAFAAGFSTQGDYVVAGALVDKPTVGIYFFAFQLVGQIGFLITKNLRMVLIPVFARLKDDVDRAGDALYRSLRATMTAMPLLTIALGCVIAPLEFAIWGGKWAAAVVPIQIFACSTPFRTVMGIEQAALLATDRFSTYFKAQVIRGVAVVVAATLGSLIGGTAESLAIAVGTSSIILAPALTAHIVGHYGMTLRQLGLVFIQGPLLALTAAVGAHGVAWLVLPNMVQFSSEEPTRISALVEVAVLGVVYIALYLAIGRLFIRPALLDLIGVMPKKLARPARKLLRLAPAAGRLPDPNESVSSVDSDDVA